MQTALKSLRHTHRENNRKKEEIARPGLVSNNTMEYQEDKQHQTEIENSSDPYSLEFGIMRIYCSNIRVQAIGSDRKMTITTVMRAQCTGSHQGNNMYSVHPFNLDWEGGGGGRGYVLFFERAYSSSIAHCTSIGPDKTYL